MTAVRDIIARLRPRRSRSPVIIITRDPRAALREPGSMITAVRRRRLRDRDCRLTSRIRLPITDLMMLPIITTINLADS
jgi:hypothetical protein